MKGRIDETGIKKGPWSVEEDEVLINFVNQNGPTGWSSIRSKGLLPRTGKSCRLRWVNKLRPDLKVGCKFTAEEERIVVELQSRYGNKWAKIASHLNGRTDNDVKNFWSSRQKRLARLLHSSSSSQSYSKTHRQFKHKSPLLPQLPPSLQVSSENEPPEPSSKSSNTEPISSAHLTFPSEAGPFISPIPLTGPVPIPIPIPDPTWFTQLANPMPPIGSLPAQTNTQVLLPDFVNVFGVSNSCPDLFPSINDHNIPLLHENITEIGVNGGDKLVNPDGFFDDFPTDVFDSFDPPLPACSAHFPHN